MATLTADAPPSAPAPETRRGLSWFAVRGPAQVIAAIGAVLAVWIVLFTVFRGRNTLALAPADTNALHNWQSIVKVMFRSPRSTPPT